MDAHEITGFPCSCEAAWHDGVDSVTIARFPDGSERVVDTPEDFAQLRRLGEEDVDYRLVDGAQLPCGENFWTITSSWEGAEGEQGWACGKCGRAYFDLDAEEEAERCCRPEGWKPEDDEGEDEAEDSAG